MKPALRWSAFRPLRTRSYAIWWAASALSDIGTWNQAVAVGAMVTARTGRATWTVLASAAYFLPMGLLSPIGGTLADQLNLRRFLLVGNLMQALVTAILVVLAASGRASPATMILIVFVSGCLSALTLPGQTALVPDLVDRDDILAAQSLLIAQYNVARIVGPALAGLVIALASYTWTFAINAVSFLVVVAALQVLTIRDRPRSDTPGVWSRLRAGVQVMRSEPGCRAAVLFIALAGLLASPFVAMIPAKANALVEGGIRATGTATGALTTAMGLGAVVGALLVAPLAERFGRKQVLLFYLLATPVALCLYASTKTLGSAVLWIASVSTVYIGIVAGLSTVVQLTAPADFRGRTLGLYFTVFTICYPLGALMLGAAADQIGLTQTTVFAAAMLAVAVIVIRATKPHLVQALSGVPVEAKVVHSSA